MHWQSERVLVLGADGFLGRHAVRMLRERGAEVHPVGRTAGDFADWPMVESVFLAAPKVTRIYHLITHQRTGQTQYDIQGELLAQNARIHLNVLEAWRLHQPQAKLVSTSSSCAYPEFDRPICEEDFQTGPMHESVRGYGLAKQMLAVGSEAYALQYGLKYLHVFLATVYGPYDHKAADRTHFMSAMIDRAVREMRSGQSAFTVWGEPGTVRDLLYVDDQVEAIFEADRFFENVRLNCSSNAPVTINDCAIAICSTLGWAADITYPKGTFQGTGYKTLNAKRFLTGTGWRPKFSLSDGVLRVLRAGYNVGVLHAKSAN